MSASASPPVPIAKPQGFLCSTVGLKVVMAVTGLVLVLFVIGHMIGNLQVYAPFHEGWALDKYGKLLRELGHGGAIWVVRAGLLAVTALHVGSAWMLTRRNFAARPVGYRAWQARTSTYASRTMRVTGPLLLAFVVYHVLHLTIGSVHPDFHEGAVHANVIAGFSQLPAAIAYIVAMLMLGLHLHHGTWSLLQSLGLSHPRYNPLRRGVATLVAGAVVLGNCSIPISVLAGWVHN
jgi:succinate dehydrogenase / fumarate reductase cytochrome b subunit